MKIFERSCIAAVSKVKANVPAGHSHLKVFRIPLLAADFCWPHARFLTRAMPYKSRKLRRQASAMLRSKPRECWSMHRANKKRQRKNSSFPSRINSGLSNRIIIRSEQFLESFHMYSRTSLIMSAILLAAEINLHYVADDEYVLRNAQIIRRNR